MTTRSARVTADDILVRFTDRTGDCWLWTGACNKRTGYGQRYYERRNWLAHRLSYETYVGPIPPGMQIDHVCREIRCVNPAHLEAVTAHENLRRASAANGIRGAATHCPQGHLYDEKNTHVKPGKPNRSCRACAAAYQRAKTAARKAVSV